MEYVIFFLLGAVISLIFTRAPIKIEVHHKHENVLPPATEENLRSLEEQMTKPDAKMDQIYEEINKLSDIMGGSDR